MRNSISWRGQGILRALLSERPFYSPMFPLRTPMPPPRKLAQPQSFQGQKKIHQKNIAQIFSQWILFVSCVTTNGQMLKHLELVGARRFELPTPCSQSRYATRLRYAPTITCERSSEENIRNRETLIHLLVNSSILLLFFPCTIQSV